MCIRYKMQPLLKKNDLKLFSEYLDKLNNDDIYFEFGSGGSTYHACMRENINTVISVESDPEWFERVSKSIPFKHKLEYKYIDINNKPCTWGRPGSGATYLQQKAYSDSILHVDEHKRKNIRMILIDGRYRVACCLKCFDVIDENCVVLFDDFLPRKQYYDVLKFYNIDKQTSDNNMVLMKKKPNTTMDYDTIRAYECVAD